MATRQTLQLEDLSYEYELFRENQLLTHDQLNKFIHYFEDQDRLTRTCLVGVGLVCGLSAKLKNNVITVSQGCAVTTDGDLLKLDTTDYKYFKAYSNLTRGKGDPIYDPFFPPSNSGAQVKLWELFVDNKVETGTPPDSLSSFQGIAGTSITNMVALLYLEYYLSEPDDCTSIDCDHLGQLQNAKIKVLLISQQDMDKVINSEPTEIIADHIYKSYYEAYDRYFVLPELKARRLPMSPLNTASLGALTQGYTNIVKNGAAELISAVGDLYNTFQFILDPAKYFNIVAIKNKLNTMLTSAVKPYQVQYLYDFYKDIMDGYNEIKDTIYNAIYICCPDKYAFPKHIMLGIVNADLGPKPPKYRHYFYPSPAVTKNKSYLSVAKSMFNRLVDMNNNFSLPDQPADVRITPSVEPDKQIEWRAIPFYYKNAANMRQHWSYYRTMRGTDKNVLSYYGQDYGENDMTRKPLDYDVDKNNFFRIEGHIGKKMSDAITAISNIRDDKSLPFDVVAVRMDENQQMQINLDDFACQFDDLNAVLNAWIVQQDCLYAKTVKFFSSFDDVGRNRLPVKGQEANNAVNIIRNAENVKAVSNIRYSVSNRNTLKAQPQAKASGANTGDSITGNYSLPKTTFVYQVDDTVRNNLNLEDNTTVGAAFHQVYQNNITLSGDAYIAMLMQLASVNAAILALNSDVREIVYNIPSKLVARINEVTKYKPFEVKDLDTDVLDKYSAAINALCDEAEASFNKAEAIFAKATWVKQGYESNYLNALVELNENCCAADALDSLIDEIGKRKQKILESLSFAKYAAQHNGLEHMAGVPRGGTFVLLYAVIKTPGTRLPANTAVSFDVRISEAAANMSSRAKTKAAAPDISGFYDKDEDTFLLELVQQKETVDAPQVIKEYATEQGYNIEAITGKVKISNLLSRANIFAAALEAELANTVNNEMVVADFCLPYICCSDCPPMVFVVPRQQYSLALPKAVACSDEAMLEFMRMPADGVVDAMPGFEQTIVTGEDGKVYFDPAQVQPADYEKEITFTIDSQVTDCTIKVSKHPTANFTYHIDSESDAAITVTFTNTSDDATGKLYDYEWDFNDGRPVQKAETKDPITITYNKTRFGTATSFNVGLKAINGACFSNASQTIPLTATPVNLVPEKTVVCSNSSFVNFTLIQPANGVVKCKEVPGAVILSAGKFVFNPGAVPAVYYGIPLHFTVNDKDVAATITVMMAPDASFTVDDTTVVRTGDLLKFDIIVKNNKADFYSLAMNGVTIASDLGPNSQGVIHLTDIDVKGISGNVELELTASNMQTSPPVCGPDTGKDILNVPEPQSGNCGNTVSEFISKSIEQLSPLKSVIKDPNLSDVNTDYLNNVYIRARDNFSSINDTEFQLLLLSRIKERFGFLMNYRTDNQQDIGYATLILRLIMEMALNIVRCDQDIDKEVESALHDIIDAFTSAVQQNDLPKTYPGLNQSRSLTLFLEAFESDFSAPGTGIPAMVADLINLINDQF